MNLRVRYTPLLLCAVLFLLPSVLAFGFQVSSNPQGFLSVRGRWIVDSLGRVVLLCGVNYAGLAEADRPHFEGDYSTFAFYGFNVVRLEISWANLEPMPNKFQASYLNYIDQDVAWAKAHGLYVVLEMTQFRWAARFGGGGAPEWTVGQYPQTDDGMKAAISNFWVNSSLQANLAGVWRNVAKRYANEPTVAGYDIFNEPWAFREEDPNLQASQVTQFYDALSRLIREVDPHHILFLQPAVQNTHSNPVNDANVVWSPHFYARSYADTYSHDSLNVLEADLLSKYNEFVVGMGSPMWIGEFGAFMKDSTRLTWIQDAKDLFDKYRLGWAWFVFHPGGFASVPIMLRNPTTTVWLYTVTVTSSISAGELPPLPAIPGFPWEAIIVGLALGLAALGLKRRRAKKT